MYVTIPGQADGVVVLAKSLTEMCEVELTELLLWVMLSSMFQKKDVSHQSSLITSLCRYA